MKPKQKPQPQTMNEMYGDGSNHIACSICGFCKTCKDCVCATEDYKKGYEQGLADERAKTLKECHKQLIVYGYSEVMKWLEAELKKAEK